MERSNNTDEIVNALRKVPTKSLRIIELANQIPIKNGEFDPAELENRKVEINLAIEEAKLYGGHTLRAAQALIEMRPGEPKEV